MTRDLRMPAAPVPGQIALFNAEPCLRCGGTGLDPGPTPSAPARTQDPQTSHAGNASHASRDVRRFSPKSQTGRLLVAFHREGGLTDLEAAMQVLSAADFHTRIEGTRRRCSDLRAAGFLAPSGVERRNPGARDTAIVWVVTQGGIDAVARLRRGEWSHA